MRADTKKWSINTFGPNTEIANQLIPHLWPRLVANEPFVMIGAGSSKESGDIDMNALRGFFMRVFAFVEEDSEEGPGGYSVVFDVINAYQGQWMPAPGDAHRELKPAPIDHSDDAPSWGGYQVATGVEGPFIATVGMNLILPGVMPFFHLQQVKGMCGACAANLLDRYERKFAKEVDDNSIAEEDRVSTAREAGLILPGNFH